MTLTCFVIMPITTPPDIVPRYHGDDDHFQHVLDHLFTPALAGAGYRVIPPAAQGADLIHAEIVKNLELADLVLCDVSTLNANVFFELGIRTALDKPVCMVRDQHTTALPFDTAIINFFRYDGSLAPWTLGNEVKRLTAHLITTQENAGERNALWRYFGLTRRAERSAETSDPVLSRLEIMTAEIHALRRERVGTSSSAEAVSPPTDRLAVVIEEAQAIAAEINAKLKVVSLTGDEIEFSYGNFMFPLSSQRAIEQLAGNHGYTVSWVRETPAKFI